VLTLSSFWLWLWLWNKIEGLGSVRLGSVNPRLGNVPDVVTVGVGGNESTLELVYR